MNIHRVISELTLDKVRQITVEYDTFEKTGVVREDAVLRQVCRKVFGESDAMKMMTVASAVFFDHAKKTLL